MNCLVELSFRDRPPMTPPPFWSFLTPSCRCHHLGDIVTYYRYSIFNHKHLFKNQLLYKPLWGVACSVRMLFLPPIN